MRHSTLTEVAVPSPLSKSLWGTLFNHIKYSWIYHWQVWPKVSHIHKQSTIASPETSTHKSCCHSYATVVPSQAYSPFIVAKLHVNGKANCTLAQRHQKDNSICPTSSGELKPIQATQTSDFPSLSSGFRTSNRITEVLYYVNRNQMSLSLSAASNSSSGYSSAINLRNRTESALTEHTQASST